MTGRVSLKELRTTHFHQFPFGASIILGNNGFVWISQTLVADDETSGGIMLGCGILIYEYKASGKYGVTELLSPDCMKDVAILTQTIIT